MKKSEGEAREYLATFHNCIPDMLGDSKVFSVQEVMDVMLAFLNDTPSNKKSIEERLDRFHKKCLEYLGEYTDEMLAEFVSYWTEHNEQGSKMRCEMSKNQPFNLKRRLATWKKRSNENGKSDNRMEKIANF